MLEELARKWARLVSRGKGSPMYSVLVAFNGLVFIALYIFGIVPSEILLGLGILLLFVGFHLFERYGLLMLIDDIKRKPG